MFSSKQLRPPWRVGLAAGALGILLGAASPAWSVQLASGKTYFLNVPKLLNTTAYNRVINFQSNFVFTIAVPANAGEPLKRVEIDLGDYGTDMYLDLNRSLVVQADQPDQRYAIEKMSRDPDPRKPVVSLSLAEPVPPGNTVRLELFVAVGPRIGGTHLFGVTAYPPGENAHGQFLGFGRTRIDDN
ncbi:DUF2808 domain-containing protein [Gloeobacter kilaueensis]|uniref:DUF2808 domain-containing protein n=1 Tax=Gloeobacter kilaueensis (strain ATCC BAA-2537 / CCAP 1431/1 / ULC 316 / JS1) TaxID=1183438 RepID=U5QJH8_GLOK1|nr:DUF2808 domain-containing protein [Gloeobacter kilaueensis]AGY57779.1 hypothetical protein GKIL_1533 [Gloeobacter kilaueensis JS1]